MQDVASRGTAGVADTNDMPARGMISGAVDAKVASAVNTTPAAAADASKSRECGLGQEFTDTVIQSMGPKTDLRMREIMGSLIQHLHDFAREVQLTADEWLLGIEFINAAGQMSTPTRNETQLMCDVLGLESYVPLYLVSHYPLVSLADGQARRWHHV